MKHNKTSLFDVLFRKPSSIPEQDGSLAKQSGKGYTDDMTGISALSDIFIQYLFNQTKHKTILLDFINAVLLDAGFEPLVSVEIGSPINPRELASGKSSVLDIKAIDKDGRIYEVEVQRAGNAEFVHRSLYYWSKNYSAQLDSAEPYKQLKPVICINLLGFAIFDQVPRAHTCFLALERQMPELALSDHFQLHFLELAKLPGVPDKLKSMRKELKDWLYFFVFEGKGDSMIQFALQDNPVLQKAHKAYKTFTADEKLSRIAFSEEKRERDRISRLYSAHEEGLAKGMEQGMEQGMAQGLAQGEHAKAVAIARKLKDEGVSTQKIAELVDLTVEEIEKL